ncbi:MAG: class I SAM-dependent methyltransferase [Dehalococcoidia bacterium]
MNKVHLEYCSSEEWAAALRKWIVPMALENVDLGDDTLEVGPGPGRTTDLLREMTPKLTAVEIDKDLADALSARMANTNVKVVNADATSLPFPDGRFSGAVSFIMLHHVPTPADQDRLLAEVARVLKKGGTFAGCDSLDGEGFRQMHVGDICVPIPPDGFAERLKNAGFSDVTVDPNPYVLNFRAVR